MNSEVRDTRKTKARGISGQALIVVITFLAMLFVIGIAFFSLAMTERVSSMRHLDALRSRYIAEAGAVYAQKVLKSDVQENYIDSLEDISFKNFSGQGADDADLDGDGQPDSRWFTVNDAEGQVIGRFSVIITDESSKVNVNSCQRETLENILSQLGAASGKASNILADRPFNAIEELGAILGKNDFAKCKNYLTIYSRDLEIDIEKKRRIYLNSHSGRSLLDACLNSGVSRAYQKAANLKDAADEDLAQTILDKFTLGYLWPNQLIETGSWVKVGNFYEAPAGGEAGKFLFGNLPLDNGDYYCFLYGPSETDYVGEVVFGGEESETEAVMSGDGLNRKVTVSGKSLTLQIQPSREKTSRFSYIELVDSAPRNGLVHREVHGTEALAINELMVKLFKEIPMPEAVEIEPAKDFRYTFTGIRPGIYYVVLLAQKQGGPIGDVSIKGEWGRNLYDGNYFPHTVEVNADGTLVVYIKNNSFSAVSFQGIRISQQPDAEYIEIVNLSPKEIDMGNFTFEVYTFSGEQVSGWPARVPEGSKILPYQHLVFSVDSADSSPSPQKITGNNISFQRAWGASSVGLIFDEYGDTIDKNYDLLPDGGAKIILRDTVSRQVDAIEYTQENVKDFTSLERADPSSKSEGIFHDWYPSEDQQQATPAAVNEHSAMYTIGESGKPEKHNPSEIIVYNRKLLDFTEVEKLSAGGNWQKFSLSDISRMQDHVAYNAIELSLAGHYLSGDFKEKGSYFESTHESDMGTWEFPDIPAGNYLMAIKSSSLNTEALKIKAAYTTKTENNFSATSSLMFTCGAAFFGRIDLAGNGLVILQVQITNDSQSILRIEKIILEPVFSVPGRININTAKQEVLNSILNSGTLAQKVLRNRPIGMRDARNLGLGEIFLDDPAFIAYNDFLTTKSDVYELLCRGESTVNAKTSAFQTVRVVLERGE